MKNGNFIPGTRVVKARTGNRGAFNVYCGLEATKWISEYARKNGVSSSELIRQIVKKALPDCPEMHASYRSEAI